MKTLLITISLLIFTTTNFAQEPLKLEHFQILNNSNWKGTLTYKDYQSGKLSIVETTLQIEIKGDKILSNLQYTYEPQKNNKSSVRIKNNGTFFGNEKVVSNTIKDGLRTFVSTYKGKDDGKKAFMYITHTFSQDFYKVVKEVQYEGSDNRFVRNTYEYKRI